MPNSLEAVAAEALQLTTEQRADLVERLIASIEPSLPLHPEWEAEIARRIADIDSGRTKAIPGEQVFAKVRALIDKHTGK